MDELFEDGRVDFFLGQDDLMAVAEALVISAGWFRARHTAQGVRNRGLGARSIGYDKVELRKKLGPADIRRLQKPSWMRQSQQLSFLSSRSRRGRGHW